MYLQKINLKANDVRNIAKKAFGKNKWNIVQLLTFFKRGLLIFPLYCPYLFLSQDRPV
jgi:hypothetical protein